MKNGNNQKGFGVLENILLLAIAAILIFAAWYVWDTNKKVYKEPVDSTPPAAVSHGGPVKDYVSFIDNLRSQGAKVEPLKEFQDAAFTVTGQQISVDGEKVNVYEYKDEAAAKDDLHQDTKMIDWKPGTRIYQKAKIIAVYSSNKAATQKLLQKLLGDPTYTQPSV